MSVSNVPQDFFWEFHLTVFRNPHGALPFHDTINDAITGMTKTSPGIKKTELVARFGKSRPTIERAIAKLKKQGLIEYRGSKKTGGYYPLPQPSGETPP